MALEVGMATAFHGTDAVWLPGNSHEKSEPGRLTALGLSRTMLMLQRWLTDVLNHVGAFWS
jgi:hypothetical protein